MSFLAYTFHPLAILKYVTLSLQEIIFPQRCFQLKSYISLLPFVYKLRQILFLRASGWIILFVANLLHSLPLLLSSCNWMMLVVEVWLI